MNEFNLFCYDKSIFKTDCLEGLLSALKSKLFMVNIQMFNFMNNVCFVKILRLPTCQK